VDPKSLCPRSGKHVTDRCDRSRNLSFEDLQAVQYLSVKTPTTPPIEVMIQGVRKRFLVDTDASVSVVKSGTSKAPLCRTTLKPQGVTGKELHVLGTHMIYFTIGSRTLGHEFIVSDLPIPADELSGNEFLLEREAVIIIRIKAYLDRYKIKFYNLYQSNRRLRWSRGSVLAFSTQVCGFKPGRSRRIFRAKKSSAGLPSERK